VRARRIALGAVKLGDGPKARLRFPREAIDAYLAATRVGGSESAFSEPQPAPKPRRRGAARHPFHRCAQPATLYRLVALYGSAGRVRSVP
jgi:hypothetical protein